MIELSEILSSFIILFAVIDMPGAIPIVINVKENVGPIKPIVSTLVSTIILVGFLFVGESILSLLGVDIDSFAVAGSFILAFIAFEMILGIRIFRDSSDSSKAATSIVPIAFPIIAGAGTMTTIVSLRAEYASINIIAAILLNMIVVYLVLSNIKRIEKIIGPAGIGILKKVFGIILLSMAVKLFSSNALSLFTGAQ